MFARYIEGKSVNTIAKEFGRSSRTVHQVLTNRGTHSLPERDQLLSNELSDELPSHTQRRPRRRKKPADGDGDEEGPSDNFMKRVEPILAEGAVKYLKENPEFAIQVATAILGIKLDKPTLDELRPGVIATQLITHVEVTPSSGSDTDVSVPVVDGLAERKVRPDELFADTAYGSGRN